jgi:sugar/nucleoside kinase (ribokinase family)
MKTADDFGLVTSLDLCAVDPNSDAAKSDWKTILERVLPYVDFFLPSIGDFEGIMIDDAESADARQLANELKAMGAKCIMIKLGEKGMYYNNPGAEFFRGIEKKMHITPHHMENWENREGYIPAAEPEKIVSGLGAGDVTIAAYLAAIMHSKSFDETLSLALTEGALCLSDPSATGGIKPFSELTDMPDLF